MWVNAMLESPYLPWRARQRIAHYLERTLYQQRPDWYQRLFVGKQATAKAVTQGPDHHFFGYYDKSPWSEDGQYLLAHCSQIGFSQPQAGDAVTIGMVALVSQQFIPLAQSYAWNYQQGAMLQWLPNAPTQLIFNDFVAGHFISRVIDIQGHAVAQYDTPVYALHPKLPLGYSLNFARLARLRPDYGYCGSDDPFADQMSPSEDGVFLLDMTANHSRLIISLAQLAQLNPLDSMSGAMHWVNHIQVSPKGDRIAFLHRWKIAGQAHQSRLYSAASDGSDLRCLLDTQMVSHYDWLNESQLMVWANTVDDTGCCYQLVDIYGQTQLAIDRSVFAGDGHCSFSPDRRWVLTDTYPDLYRKQELYVFEVTKPKQKQRLARLLSCDAARATIRCDLHPRWRQDGKQVCIDSSHDGTRQIYLLNLDQAG